MFKNSSFCPPEFWLAGLLCTSTREFEDTGDTIFEPDLLPRNQFTKFQFTARDGGFDIQLFTVLGTSEDDEIGE